MALSARFMSDDPSKLFLTPTYLQERRTVILFQRFYAELYEAGRLL